MRLKCAEKRLWVMETSGEMRSAWEMESPPMSAYWNFVAEGKVWWDKKWSRKMPQDYFRGFVSFFLLSLCYGCV